MKVMVSLSPAPMAHPPRSNPFLRSSSEAPPFPCITPSTVTCVVVVSLMIAVPFPLGRPSQAPSYPCHEHLRPDPTPPHGLLSRTHRHGDLGGHGSRPTFGHGWQASVIACSPAVSTARLTKQWWQHTLPLNQTVETRSR